MECGAAVRRGVREENGMAGECHEGGSVVEGERGFLLCASGDSRLAGARSLLFLGFCFPELVDELLERLHLRGVHQVEFQNEKYKVFETCVEMTRHVQSMHTQQNSRTSARQHTGGPPLLRHSACLCVCLRVRSNGSNLLAMCAIQMCVKSEQSFIDLFDFRQELTRELRVLLHGEQNRIRDPLIGPT